jgi:hemolysin activation/secretion protein
MNLLSLMRVSSGMLWLALGAPTAFAQAGDTAPDAVSAPVTAEADAGKTFDIWEFAVAGNTTLDSRVIEKTVYPFLGPGRTVRDVDQARAALEKRYQDAGYGTVVVNIPEQDVVQGLVRLEVIEGKVDRLFVSGATYFSPDRIRAGAPSLAQGSVPLLPQVQKELVRLNAGSSDRRITPVLRPGRYPGTLEAELKVDDKLPVHGSLEVNNRYTRDTTRTRATATLSYDNLWQRQHSASIGYQTAPENTDDVTVLFGTYSARLPNSAWLMSGYYVDSDTAVSTVGTLGVLGKGQIAGLRFIRPLSPLAGGFQRVTLGIDFKDFDESIALTGNQPSIETPIDYGIVSAGWGLTLVGEGRTSELNLLGVLGPRFLGNEAGEFANKRSGAKPSFAYLGLNLAHERELWAETRLRFDASVQIADSPLISNEQFAFGGAGTVRGYLESQQFVDDGLFAQLELLSPDWGEVLPGFSSARLFTFLDVGAGRLQDPQPEQSYRFLLWSTGVGWRAALWRRLTAEVEWAQPLRGSDDGSVQSGDARWHFNTRYSF